MILAALLSVAIIAQDNPPPATPTPQEMFVACYLAMRHDDAATADAPFGTKSCLRASFLTALHYEGGAKADGLRFCLPAGNSRVEANMMLEMAANYVTFYNRHADQISRAPAHEINGQDAFAMAQAEAWPCND